MDDKNFLEKCAENFAGRNADTYAPLNLAYIGDAVFDILVRSRIMAGGRRPVNELNKIAASLVKASSQAQMYHKIENKLTEEEAIVMKRGRNAKSFTHAKNASVIDYRHATGLESLFGYLYVEGRIDRLMELFDICIEGRNIVQ